MSESPQSAFPSSSRRLAAVMFTDIVGYSKLMGADESATLAFLQRHNQILRTAIEAHRGRVVKTIGDAFMAEFGSVGDALQCAAEAQRALAASEAAQGYAQPRRIRIGVQTGEVNVTPEGDLFGDTVNLASRLEGQAPAGGVCVSRAVVEQLKSRLELSFAKAGKRQLKNIAGQSEIFFLDGDGLDLGVVSAQRRKWHRALIVGTVTLALAALGGPWGLGAFREWRNNQGWELVLDQTFQDQEHASKAFEVYPNQIFVEGGMSMGGPIYLKEPRPSMPIRMRVQYRPSTKDYSRAVLVLPFMTKTGWQSRLNDRYRSVNVWGPAAGLVVEASRRKVTLHLGRANTFEGGVDRTMTTEHKLDLGAGTLTTELTLEKDIFTFRGPKGLEASSLYRPLKSLDRSKIGAFFWGDGILMRVQLYTRGKREDDLLGAADSYLASGKTDLAVSLYDDLLAKATDEEIACRLLYRKALAFSGAGRMPEAAKEFQKLIDDHRDNAYTGYARMDLGLLYMDAAEKLRGQGIPGASEKVLAYAQGADKLFRDLIQRQGDHPEYWRARWQQGRNSYLNIRRLDKAAREIKALLSDPQFPFWQDTFEDLWRAHEMAAPQERAASKQFVEGINDDLLKIYAQDDGRREYVLYTRVRQLRRFGDEPEFERAWRAAWADPHLSTGARESFAAELQARAEEPGRLKAIESMLNAVIREGADIYVLYQFLARVNRDGPLTTRCIEYFRSRKVLREVRASTSGRPWPLEADGNVETFGSEKQRVLKGNREGGLSLDYDSGQAWGCGFKTGPGPSGRDEICADMAGSSKIEFEVFGRPGLKYRVILSEGGIGPPDASAFPGCSGSDGEQYLLADPGVVRICGAGWDRGSISLENAVPATNWGNQMGNRILDLQGLRFVEFAIEGKQGKGTIKVRNVVFKP